MSDPFWTRARRAATRYVRNILVAIDQFFNTLIGGDPDWTISAWLGACVKDSPCRFCKWVCVNICGWLDKIDKRHCDSAREADPDEGANDAWNVLLGENNRWGWLLRLVMLLILLLIGAHLALAHDALPTADQPQGWNYSIVCCHRKDCRRVEEDEQASFVQETRSGWYIKPLDELIPFGDKREQLSQDRFFHWCKCDVSYPDAIPCTVGKTRCLYVPGAGM